jgi:endonuclease YncB( thermonuclease family)
MQDLANPWAIPLLLLLALPAEALPVPAAAPAPNYQVLSVGDGDTITVRQGSGDSVRVRLACIDGPEMAQRPAGPAARAALQQLLPVGSPVVLAMQTTDRYGRTVAEVFRAGTPTAINQTLVQEGYAFVYGRYLQQCDQASYTAAEASAAQAKRGIWGPLGQGLIKPWDFRANQRTNQRAHHHAHQPNQD